MPTKVSDVMNLLYTAAICLLLGCTVFFVKRLVDKLESLEQIVWQLRQDVVVLQTLEGVKRERKH